jgi:DNA recombination protein RmuC
MFVPIEPALMLAISEDNGLYQEAWQRNVLLVSPSTLLFVLRTVAYLWGQEKQQQNAQEIAKRGAEVYDKLCAFVADLDKLGERLEQAQRSLQDAKIKLSGRGGAISQADKLKKLGVKPSKELSHQWVEDSKDEVMSTSPEITIETNRDNLF